MIFLQFLFYLSSILAFAEVNPTDLSKQTLKRFERVPEFEFIIQEAEKLGVKVYLFGGTASAFAHYVRWDLEREAGDTKYQAERFDYDFTNIYRSNQDLDIVVDGSSKQAHQLKAILQKEYPHFVGDRDAWEVRLLRESRGDKQALIGDEDFRKQHSDTNSTGMLLLNPDPGGIVYNDLLNWGSADSDFLNDVATARIKFLFSNEHEETKRFKEGRNPPVLAAIRYLAKLAQYEVEGTSEDLQIVTQIITETDFTELSSYGKKKAEEFALKTLLNAPDSEYAWNLLEKTGARSKLIEMDKERLHNQDTLSWWMNKEPLRSKDFGTEEKTAREIFGTEEIIVAHETNNFKAYDNITRSSKGGANAFISRSGIVGEAAAFGDGFYTRLGFKGARNTGLTIRFKLHPQAREGADFIRAHDFVIVKNKKALTLIQENLNITMIDFLKLTISGHLNKNDRGLIEKFKRKFNRLKSSYSKDFQEAKDFVQQSFKFITIANQFDINVPNVDEIDNFSTLTEVFLNQEIVYNRIFLKLSLLSQNIRDTILEEIVEKGIVDHLTIKYIAELPPEQIKEKWIQSLFERGHTDFEIADTIIPTVKWKNKAEWIEKLLNKNNNEVDFSLIQNVLSEEPWIENEKWITQLFEKNDIHIDLYLSAYVLPSDYWQNNSEIIETLVERGHADSALIAYILPLEKWKNRHDIIFKLLDKHNNVINSALIASVFAKSFSPFYEKVLEQLIQDPASQQAFIPHIIENPLWKHRTDWVQKLLNTNEHSAAFVEHVLSQSYYDFGEQLLDDIIKLNSGGLNKSIIKNILSKKFWSHRHDLLEEFVFKENYFPDLLRYVFSKPFWSQYDNYLSKLILNNKMNDDSRFVFMRYVLSQKRWSHRTDIVEHLLNQMDLLNDRGLIIHVFSQPHWQVPEKFIKLLIERGHVNDTLIEFVFSRPEWMNKFHLIKDHVIEYAHLATATVNHLLTKKDWPLDKELTLKFIKMNLPSIDKNLATLVFSNAEKWIQHPELIDALVRQGNVNLEIEHHVFSKDLWKNSPVIKDYLQGKPLTVKNWLAQKENFNQWRQSYKQSTHQCFQLLSH